MIVRSKREIRAEVVDRFSFYVVIRCGSITARRSSADHVNFNFGHNARAGDIGVGASLKRTSRKNKGEKSKRLFHILLNKGPFFVFA